jgi:hypothetical protein
MASGPLHEDVILLFENERKTQLSFVQVAQANRHLKDTKELLHGATEELLSRGLSLERVEAVSSDLLESSTEFENEAKRTNSRWWCCWHPPDWWCTMRRKRL